MTLDVDALVREHGLETIASRTGERGARFTGDEPTVALYIQRSKNQNVVVYRAAYDGDAADAPLSAAAPIDAYWMDIDPEYVKANRESGKMDDRVELNIIDRTMAYGHSCSEPKQCAADPRVVFFDVTFVALPKRPMHLLSAGGRRPVILVEIGGVPSVAIRIYVKATEPKHFWNLPSVEYVELFGTSVATGEPTYEKIMQ